MNPHSEKEFDPKKIHEELQKKKKMEQFAATEQPKKSKTYKLNYNSENLEFAESDCIGNLSLPKYPIFARQELLESEEWKAKKKHIDKALGKTKIASEKAEDGIKILERKSGSDKNKDWSIADKIVLVELKTFGGKESGGTGTEAWNWRAVGVKDDNQGCIILLEQLSQSHTGSKLSDLCKEMEKKLANLNLKSSPKKDSQNTPASTLKESSSSKQK